jgi:hypothetical protein
MNTNPYMSIENTSKNKVNTAQIVEE